MAFTFNNFKIIFEFLIKIIKNLYIKFYNIYLDFKLLICD